MYQNENISKKGGEKVLAFFSPYMTYCGPWLVITNFCEEVSFMKKRSMTLILGSAFFGMIVLVGGQMIVEHVFSYTVPVSVFITVGEGIYFLYLLLTNRRV